MKTIKFLLLFLLFTPAIVLAQEENKTDAKGLKTGKWKVKHENGVTRYIGEFKDGKPIGEFKYFYETGDLKSVIKFKSDGKTSYATFYYPKEDGGKMMSNGEYIDQKKDSLWTYYDYAGTKTYTQDYKDDLEDGKKFIYYVSGKKSEAFNYVKGKKEGDWAQYYEKGTKRATCKYKDDLLEGKFTIYNSSTGKPEDETNYKKGLKHGLCSLYDDSDEGKLLKQVYFKEGTLVPDKKVEEFKKELLKEKESTGVAKDTKTNTTKSTATKTTTTGTKTITNAVKK